MQFLFYLRFQPSDPVIEPHFGFGRYFEDRHAGMDLGDACPRQVHVEIEIGQKVDLVEQGGVAFPEHQGVFGRFVLAFGDRQDHHALVLADVELGRADQVADVLHDEQVDAVKIQAGHGAFDHMGRQVAIAAEFVGVDLHDRRTGLGQSVGINRGADVTHDHGATQPWHDAGQGFLQGGGLARTRRTHHVEHENAFLGKGGTQARGHGVIGVQDPSDHLDFPGAGPAGFHRMTMIMVVMVVGVVMAAMIPLGEAIGEKPHNLPLCARKQLHVR
ncbi:hypothetical protein DESC_720056 [Desulfosarcina cetonica]|nr:hypothetical protein DESC_720056 [Desulfosarcina cetonica]